MLVKLLVATTLAATLSGCVVSVGGKHGLTDGNSAWEKTQQYNQEQVNNLQLDMPIDSVRGLMGKPDFSELFTKEDVAIQVLFYRTHHVKSDGKTTKDECTPLIFKQNKLVGWGDKAYQYL
ncbi:DUF3192 domain-containing protein [Rheinheimera sp. MMS21-TC3]|uniref:DUF3192 domain-containing protein n=1 Tax=Rheinheimera sp. MMS21-TC3 TaxID=3072790 RepID=UPI0028C4D9C7|nr:DUF3192 domain-containing protein [Rheinheimera sp. MMS21-TC3]WNO62019.1 DUF3192 domain-containing protein [Rheinheimera sp. MMS21-TC3]